MTVNFSNDLIGPGFNQTLYAYPQDPDPFAVRKPVNEGTIRVVQVRKENLAHIAHRALKKGVSNIYIPGDRLSITIGDKRFDMGEWIIEDLNAPIFQHLYRHATEEEARAYGLVSA